VSRKDTATCKNELKWHPFEGRHGKKEVPAEQPDGEGLEPVLGNRHAWVPLQNATTPVRMARGPNRRICVCVRLQGYDLPGIIRRGGTGRMTGVL